MEVPDVVQPQWEGLQALMVVYSFSAVPLWPLVGRLLDHDHVREAHAIALRVLLVREHQLEPQTIPSPAQTTQLRGRCGKVLRQCGTRSRFYVPCSGCRL